MSAGLAGEAAAGLALEGSGGGAAPAGGITQITSAGGTVAITNPLGPITNLEVGGVKQITSTDGSIVVTNPTGPVTDLGLAPVDPIVMQFNGAQTVGGPGPTIDYDLFWPANTVLGKFFYQFLVRGDDPANGTYFFSDGPGADHAALVGLQPSGTGGLNIFGNYWVTGGPAFSYTGQTCDVLGIGEWARLDIGRDANFTYGWVNGVMTFWIPNSGPRNSDPAGARNLYFGHYDHQTFKGRAAWGSIWDTDVFALVSDPVYAFRVSTLPQLRRLAASGIVYPDWGSHFMQRTIVYSNYGPNQIPPLTGTRYRMGPPRTGIPIFGNPFSEFANENPETLVPGLVNSLRPVLVFDKTCPAFLTAPRVTANAIVSAPISPPVDGRTTVLFTNFANRRSSFLETDNPSLGSIILGTAQPQTWRQAAYDAVSNNFRGWGVMFGLAFWGGVSSVGEFNYPALVDPASAAAAIEVTWPTTAFASGNGLGQPIGPGLVFRVGDTLAAYAASSAGLQNGWYAAVRLGNNLEVGTYTGGARATVATIPFPAGTNGIRVIPTGNSLQFYSTTNGGVAWVAQGAAIVNAFQNASTRAGIVAGGSAARISTFRAST